MGKKKSVPKKDVASMRQSRIEAYHGPGPNDIEK
jgi:hypothetical protein